MRTPIGCCMLRDCWRVGVAALPASAMTKTTVATRVSMRHYSRFGRFTCVYKRVGPELKFKRKGRPYRPAFLNFRNPKSLLAAGLIGRAARFALGTFFVFGFGFLLRARGCILRENSGTGEKGKAECGGCDGLHFDLSPRYSEPVICYCSITGSHTKVKSS